MQLNLVLNMCILKSVLYDAAVNMDFHILGQHLQWSKQPGIHNSPCNEQNSKQR